MTYRVARALVLSTFKVLFRVRVHGKEHVPSRGVYIAAASHRSAADVPFAAFVTRRRLRFLAKQELFGTWIGRRLFGALGAIPVHRHGVDRAALRALGDVLASGEPVAIFPEGTRHAGPTLGPLLDGVAYVALRAGVPILPVGIGGSERLRAGTRWRRHPARVVVVIGAPVVAASGASPGRRRDVVELTERLTEALQVSFTSASARATGRPTSGVEVREHA